MTARWLAASLIRVGDFLDLEGDEYADPNRNNEWLKVDYAEVHSVEIETPECVVINLDSMVVGFPTDHLILVADLESAT